MFLNHCFFLVPTFITKLKRSQDGLTSTKPAYDQLTMSCCQRKLPVEKWMEEEHIAMEERGENLRIFDINHEKAPSLAQITLQLTEMDNHSNNSQNAVDWICSGIKAENDQYVQNMFYYVIVC
jgi:hypothetical protein